jgi:hypothetical protein
MKRQGDKETRRQGDEGREKRRQGEGEEETRIGRREDKEREKRRQRDKETRRQGDKERENRSSDLGCVSCSLLHWKGRRGSLRNETDCQRTHI